MARSSPLGIAWIAALAVVLPLRAQEPAAKPEQPPIVLITLSAVNRDHLGCYGYYRDATPNLDAFARESVVFERACTPLASPLPAHISLMTAAYPLHHGLVDPQSVQKMAWQPTAKLRTVAMLLHDVGYRTAAIVSARNVSRTSGIDAGFQNFDDPAGFDVRVGTEVTKRAGAWLDEHKAERFFLWLHYRGALPPNLPDPEWRKPFAGDEKFGALLAARGIDPKRFELGVSKNVVIRMLFPDQNYGKAYEGMTLPPIEVETFRRMYDRYDGDLRQVDADLGALFAKLRELGVFERAIVAVVSDCGLSLGQHDALEAGDVNAENLFVPWLVHFPKALAQQPARVARPVSLVDVMPTLLARFECAASAPLLAQGDGRDALAASDDRPGPISQRQARDRATNDPGPVWALTTQRWKYVYRPEISDKLFDLDADPYEQSNVLQANAEVVADLKAKLLRVIAPEAATGKH